MPRVVARYLAVAILARLADKGARVVFVLLALEVTGSALFGGLFVAALMIPHVLAAPAVGGLADRARRRRPLYAGFLLSYGAAIAACALLLGRAPTALVLLTALAGGCFAPLATGGLSGLLRDLVPAGQRHRAYGLDVMSYNVAGIGGPAVAAVLATATGPRAATLAIAGAVAAGGLLLLTLPLPPRVRVPADDGALGALGGALAMWREPVLRAVTAATSLGALSMGALPVVTALLAARYRADYAVGALLSAAAAGSLVGSLGYARRPVGTRRPERVVMVCLFAGAVPLALAAVAPGVVAGLALFAVSGLFAGPQNAALFASRDRHAAADVHTQVFTLGAGLKMSAAALGAALGGVGAGLGGAGLLLLVAGCHAVAAGVGAVILRTALPSGQRARGQPPPPGGGRPVGEPA